MKDKAIECSAVAEFIDFIFSKDASVDKYSTMTYAEKDKKPTLESLNKTLSVISEQEGHGGRIEGAYIESDKFKEMKTYAESKIAENSNPKRKEYSLRNNNCGTFAADVLKQDPSVKDKAPVIIDSRPNSIVKEYQNSFKSLNYDPKKRQVKIE